MRLSEHFQCHRIQQLSETSGKFWYMVVIILQSLFHVGLNMHGLNLIRSSKKYDDGFQLSTTAIQGWLTWDVRSVYTETFILTSHSDLNFQLDALPKREAGIQQRMELQKEVDALKVGFKKQVGTMCVGGHNIISNCKMLCSIYCSSPLTNLPLYYM